MRTSRRPRTRTTKRLSCAPAGSPPRWRRWHVRLDITSTANGKTWTDRDSYTIFMDASTPDVWTIVGAFTHTRANGSTVFLESGRLVYDAATDTILDLHPGPHGTGSDPDEYAAAVCSALAA